MSYVAYAWIASFLFGCVVISSKLTSKYAIKNPWLLNFIWSFIVVIFTVITAIPNGVGVPHSWGNIIAAAICSVVLWVSYTLALYRLDVSVLSPLYNFRTVISVLLGAVFLGEVLFPWQYTLIFLVFVGGFIVTFDEKLKLRSFFQKGVALSLLGITASSLSAVFTKTAIMESGYWEATMWSAVLRQVLLLPTVYLFIGEIKRIKLIQILPVIGFALIETIGTLAENIAFAANVSISSVIINLPFSMILAFLFSVFAPALLEKHSIRVYMIRFAAAAIMIVSALKLTS